MKFSCAVMRTMDRQDHHQVCRKWYFLLLRLRAIVTRARCWSVVTLSINSARFDSADTNQHEIIPSELAEANDFANQVHARHNGWRIKMPEDWTMRSIYRPPSLALVPVMTPITHSRHFSSHVTSQIFQTILNHGL